MPSRKPYDDIDNDRAGRDDAREFYDTVLIWAMGGSPVAFRWENAGMPRADYAEDKSHRRPELHFPLNNTRHATTSINIAFSK